MTDKDTLQDDLLLGRVQSLVRAFGILDVLAKGGSLTLRELALAVDLPRSTAHRLLTTMEALRYVAFDRRTNRWAIGVQAFTVGAVFAQSRDLGHLGRSIMRSLATELQHCVNIAVPEGSGICYVDQAAVDGYRQTAARPGAVLPLHTTASGKMMMSHWSRFELDRYLDRVPLRARTARSIVETSGLRQELARVRERGFATDDEEHDQGLRCVAAMVFDRLGTPRGALSISDRASILGRERLVELGSTVVDAARQITSQMDPRFG
ncbi:IclR family transcriptional regulator [Sphingomonas sp. DBB INV C78]|uniref:IclR family transcriptional regulator n=1 Tax=Sphingomonas sp. DBB INV C78 TaxID=3349434 RepID=UPI0036D27F27